MFFFFFFFKQKTAYEMRISDWSSDVCSSDLPLALLDALDRGLGGQPRIDRLVDPARPALVIGEHLVGLENLAMLAVDAEFGLARHPIDLFAHLVERAVDAVTLSLGIFRDGMFDRDPRLVIDRVARA